MYKGRKYGTAIFDFDGVLDYSVWMPPEVLPRTFNDLGLRSPTDDEIAQILFKSSRKFIPEYLTVRGITDPDEHQKALRKYRDDLDALWERHGQPMPNVPYVLAALHEANITLAIGTISRRHVVDRFIEKHGFQGFFTCIVSGDDVRNHKPDPEVYLRVVEELKLADRPQLQPALVIEDASFGVAAANAAGLDCAVVPNEHSKGQDFKGADFQYATLPEILPLFI